jgi:hypothetical protein
VPNQNTRAQLDDGLNGPKSAGLFLSELRFESHVHKSKVMKVLDFNMALEDRE